MALIEIDGLPINSMGMFHGYVSHNQMVKNRPGTQLVGDGFIYGTTGLPHESLLALNLFRSY
jgi:hypothetical protein